MAKVVRLPIIMSFVVSLLCLILANGNGVHSFEERNMMMFNAQMLQGKSQLGTTRSLLLKSRQEKGAVILEMKNKDHYTENKIDSWNRKLHKQLTLDNHRVHSMQTMIQKKVSTQSQTPLSSGIKFASASYIVEAEIGGQKMVLEVDTGSDLTWVQCEPCMPCYDQQLPVFNPSISSSYQSILCSSSICESVEYSNHRTCPSSDSSSSCSYEVDYADGSYTNGELGIDNISFGDVSETSFVFGCGRNNTGSFGQTSGIIGLGKGELSLVSQSEKLGGVFSYCFPTLEDGASGSLIFGNDYSFFKNETPISYTNMVLNPMLPNLYLISLIGMKVGTMDLQVPSFGSTDGVLIDSGTAITRLTPSIYNALKEEFLRQFSDFPQVSGFEILDTCFDLTGQQEVKVPAITMYFEGNAELNVDASGILVSVEEDGSKVCLAIASLADDSAISIIGSYQQINHRIIYDTKESLVGFAKETCSFN